LIDRSLKSDGSVVDLGIPRRALAALEVSSYAPENCPMCLEGSIAIKPGSRQ
jgi:orotate phosphoribosyltransferase